MRIGIDLGGTKIEGIVLDDGGERRAELRIPTPSHAYDAIVRALTELVDALEKEVGETCTVGIGTPGSVNPATSLMRNSNTTVMNGRPLGRDLEQAMGRTVRLANDANCFALSEATDGAGAGAEVVFGVILGTGVGGGVVVGGRPMAGANGIGGEWGHNPLPWPADDERPGELCFCGKRGCIETFLSGGSLARDYRGVETLDARGIVEAAPHDPEAENALVRYEERLARALAHIVNVLDPHVIVLGGGVSNVGRLYNNVPRLWKPWITLDEEPATQLVKARFGDSSGVRGAAWLWS